MSRSRKIEVACGSCGRRFQETVARLKGKSRITCPRCGRDIDNFGAYLDATVGRSRETGKASRGPNVSA